MSTPPPPLPHLTGNYAADFLPNTSGTLGEVPPEVACHWNWGAFQLSGMWLMGHGMAGWGVALLGYNFFLRAMRLFLPNLPLLRLAPAVLLLLVHVYLGACGNRLAWQHRRFDSVSDFHRCERIWARWSLVVLVIISLYLAWMFFA